MAKIVVVGAGVGGMPMAYDVKKALGVGHEVTLIGTSEHFQFTPSNPWVGVGWRQQEDVLVENRPHVEKRCATPTHPTSTRPESALPFLRLKPRPYRPAHPKPVT